MRSALAVVLVVLAGASAAAGSGPPGTRAPTATAATAAPILFLNRCVGGCVIHRGGDDARTSTSSIPDPDGVTGQTDFTLTEFNGTQAEWDAVVKCVKEVYSPYDLTITETRPVGQPYNEEVIAGSDFELKVQAGGISPGHGACAPYNYVMSFTFANQWNGGQRVFDICRVAAQESGHAYGLDHSFSTIDGISACNDPMSYRGDCGGQRFFRNVDFKCGEYAARTCGCSATQNAHVLLLSELGPGTPTTAPPVVTVTTPAQGATIGSGSAVVATASAQRGIDKLELWLNGYKWSSVRGAAWGANGQPETGYALPIPADVPDGVIDIVVKAKDDIEVTTESSPVRVTKGAPCTSADTCAAGQRCDDQGRCLWDPPVGAAGEPCTFPQYCTSGVCAGPVDGGQMLCSQTCIPGVSDSCPVDYDCLEQSPGKGVCWPAGEGDGGCCSTSHGAATQSALLAFGLALVLRRRRR